MSSKEIDQLIEMGATRAQARAAMRQCRDVMDAAEMIFEGKIEVTSDDETDGPRQASKHSARMVTPDDDDDEDDMKDADDNEDDDAQDDYCDYDSDYDQKAEQSRNVIPDVDPYAGIFFSKDRRDEVIEIEEEPETVWIPEVSENVKLMTQGEWMKGCPEGGEQGFLFSLYSQLSNEACICPHQCGGSVQRKKSDYFAIFSDFSIYVNRLRQNVRHKCRTCSKEFCLACGEPYLPAGNMSRTSASTDPLFHCSDLQGVILGVGLSMLQHMFADQTQTGSAPLDAERTKKKRKVEAPDPNEEDEDEEYYAPGPGQARGKKAKGGTGYAGAQREDVSGQVEAAAVQRQKDEKMGKLLTDIRLFLPSVQRAGGGQTSDYLVHPTTLAHLRRRFNLVSSSLLRNDSLTDMSDRSVLYFELFEWLETISNHEALASMMAMPIMVVGSVKSVKKGSGKGSGRERTIVYEGSSGPRELMEAIVIQAQAAMKGLDGMIKAAQAVRPEEMTEAQKRMTAVGEDKGKGKDRDGSQADENVKLLQFCQRILATAAAIDRSLRETKGDAFVDRLHASLPKIPSQSTSAAEAPAIAAGDKYVEQDARKAYMDWGTRTRFEYCDLSIPPPGGKKEKGDGGADESIPSYKFFYNNDARMLAGSDIPKRSLAIAKELAVLTTNLPVDWGSSVFLRVDETRVDIIKALITGPEGTPYVNGCYLFDIFLGPNYNQSPPSVKYMTTNGGRFRFNPNLYADGKVCLSLLGTWSGPGWIAGKSTLLQVLISIQSMILCEEPYLNEPGWATQGGTPQSKAYSANVRRMVVNTAMLGNLKQPPEPFEDIIRTHFRLKARSIMKQLDEWLALDDGVATNGQGAGFNDGTAPGTTPTGSRNPFQRDVDELKTLLLKLEKDGGSSAKDDKMDLGG